MSDGGTVAVVLHYRREAMTEGCIKSLLASTRPPRVLVVDNASGDGSFERLQQRFPHCDFLQTGANLGYAGGNNRGIAQALSQGAARVLVINDDATVAPEMLAQLEDAMTASSAAVAAPTVYFGSRPELVWWGGGYFDPLRMIGRHSHYARPLPETIFRLSRAAEVSHRPDAPAGLEVSFVSGCCLLMDADALRRLGAFDESYGAYVEDVELGLRFARAGKRLLWVPRASAWHHLAFPEPVPTPNKIIARDRNRRRLARQHFGLGARLKFWAFFVPSRAFLLLRYALRGDLARMAAIVRGASAPLT